MFLEVEILTEEMSKSGHLTNLLPKDGRSFIKMKLSQNQRKVNLTQNMDSMLEENSLLFQL
jgi:NAD-dependent SIR2 family protein deacetylase